MSFLPADDRYVFGITCSVSAHDCDCAGRLRLAAALRYCEVLATAHLDALELYHARLYSEGIVFVLAAQAVKVHKLPKMHDILVLKTCPAAARGAQMMRENVILGESGERLIEVQSAWVIIDPAKRRPLRPSAFKYDLGVLDSWSPFCDPSKIRLSPASELVLRQPVLYSHLDINRHMNNTVYADLVMDALPVDEALERSPDSLLMRLRHETKAGETLEIFRSEISGGWLVSARAEENPCFEAQILFKD